MAAFFYNSLTTHIHNQHIETLSDSPLLVTNKVLSNLVSSLKPSSLLSCLVPKSVDAVVSLTAEGMVMGLMHRSWTRILDQAPPHIEPRRAKDRTSSAFPRFDETGGHFLGHLVRSSQRRMEFVITGADHMAVAQSRVVALA